MTARKEKVRTIREEVRTVRAAYFILLSPRGTVQLKLANHSFLPDTILIESFVADDKKAIEEALEVCNRFIVDIEEGRRDAFGNLIIGGRATNIPLECLNCTPLEELERLEGEKSWVLL